MKTLYEAGGVQTTILDDAMQRAPAFVFESAREARAFGVWLTEHFADIKQAAESTTRAGRLRGIEQYSASRILFTRFDYTTGDAAGQNLTGKATAAACAWILANYQGISNFYLESNFATDKKSSQVNVLRTRGKRVTAEATIPAALIEERMRSSGAKLLRARQVSNLGGFMSGANNNGLQSANGIAALFIATGQYAANVAESSAALGFTELLANGDYDTPITLPSLIVATCGGGTGLATQRECLELLGCYGTGRCASWPRSSRRPCCAAKCHSGGRSSPMNGSQRTISLAATGRSFLASSRGQGCNSRSGSVIRRFGGAW
jgi:hydroxymethylglutaryl-CoA reductase (NADPH)